MGLYAVGTKVWTRRRLGNIKLGEAGVITRDFGDEIEVLVCFEDFGPAWIKWPGKKLALSLEEVAASVLAT